MWSDMGGLPEVGGLARFNPASETFPSVPGLSYGRLTFRKPLSSDYTFVSSGLTLTDATDRLQLTVTASSAPKIATWVLPPAPYTLDFFGWLGGAAASSDATVAGIALYDGTKAYLTIGGPSSGLVATTIYSCNNLTAVSAVVQRTVCVYNGGFWALRITEDGTNRKHYYGNGRDYTLFLSQATNTFLTPTQAGIATYNGSTSPGTTASGFVAQMSVTPGILGNSP